MTEKMTDRLVTPDDMGAIDAAAIESGISGWTLMRAAGEAVAARVLRRFPAMLRAVVLAGPGNNGGDGYVAAAALANAGVDVAVFALGDPDGLKGDAAVAFRRAGISPETLDVYVPKPGDVVIDALFGAGLSRSVEGVAAASLQRVADSGVPVVAVDLPSGVSGLSGKVLGTSLRACETVTFLARKPGHLLYPGRDLCGDLTIVHIGIPRRFLALASDKLAENRPALWHDLLAQPDADSHKYTRGHLGVFSGGVSATGAARLAAAAGLSAGAGLVTVLAPGDAVAVNAAALTAVMVRQVDNVDAVRALAADRRFKAFVIGPGFGVGAKLRDFVLALSGHQVVLDADGITAFADDRDELFAAYAGNSAHLVLTPHSGEFRRLFPDLAEDSELSKVEAALRAAAQANAVMVFKGPDTVVAAPDGRAVINANAPPWLATAGAGDVLAGTIGGLLAQGMPMFEAACAAVWIHGAAATIAGRGLTADDLPAAIARVRVDGCHEPASERR